MISRVSRTEGPQVGWTENGPYLQLQGAGNSTFYKCSLDFAELKLWIALPNLKKHLLFHDFCQDSDEK